jgi:hypothetical protein
MVDAETYELGATLTPLLKPQLTSSNHRSHTMYTCSQYC